MQKKLLSKLFSFKHCLILVLSFSGSLLNAQENLALLNNTNTSTSFVSGWESLNAVNDGFTPSNSTDRTNPIYGNWNGDADYGKTNWIEYSWNFAHSISSVSIYWFTDYGGLAQPTEAYIEYWNGIEWINASDIGLALDTFNTLDNLTITASKIRVNMKSDTSTGVIEFQVFGIETTECDATAVTSKVSLNSGAEEELNYIVISPSDTAELIAELTPEATGGIMQWTGPNSFEASTQTVTLTNLTNVDSGTYTYTYVNDCGTATSKDFFVTVQETTDNFSDWPAYDNTLHYDFAEDYPNFPEPTLNLETDYPGYAGCNAAWTRDYGSWTFVAGPDANSAVTTEAVDALLKRLDDDFKYLRDNMGWPPDKLFRSGYRSSVYLFGSGLCTDSASNTDLGGWQSAVTTQDGEAWPMVLLSYYPVSSFAPNTTYADFEYQRGACVHEGIHAIYASLPGCRDAAWFHEGSNVWLQTVLDIEKAGGTGYENVDLGWLSAGSVIAPFIPIESYSGWLTDGTFGGPGAQGVATGQVDSNGFAYDQTRDILGGVQYSSVFPTFLGETVGVKCMPWIWNYAIGNVLEGMANGDGTVSGIGDTKMRQMIQEYRAKLTLADFNRFTEPILNMYRNNMGIAIDEENNAIRDVDVWYATPYAETTKDSDDYLIPNELTLPGWSGANIIPIHTNGNKVTVTFVPLANNMSMQLCYRTPTGDKFYSQPVYGGDCTISLDGGAPANGVVFAVVCNTDYIYEGESTRTAKFNYKIKLGDGAIQTADVNLNWFDWKENIVDGSLSTKDTFSAVSQFEIYPNPTEKSSSMNIKFRNGNPTDYDLQISNINGQTVYTKLNCKPSQSIPVLSLSKGLYFITVKTESYQQTKKLVVR